MQPLYNIDIVDHRPDGHQSLGVMPRFGNNDFEELQRLWKFEVLHDHGYHRAKPGELFWSIGAIEVKSGPAIMQGAVFDQTGKQIKADPGVLMMASHPAWEQLDFRLDPIYFPTGKTGWTKLGGSHGWPLGDGSWINIQEPDSHNGGVFHVWCSSHPIDFQPSNQRIVGSDCLSKIGAMWDNHITLNPFFKAMVKPGGAMPPGGGANSRIDIYDINSAKIGSIAIVAGVGQGGRLVLVVNGEEQGYMPWTEM